MRTPFSRPAGKHARSNVPPPAAAPPPATVTVTPAGEAGTALAALRHRLPDITVITSRDAITAEIDACRQRRNGAPAS
jgi:hypothetical protein